MAKHVRKTAAWAQASAGLRRSQATALHSCCYVLDGHLDGLLRWEASGKLNSVHRDSIRELKKKKEGKKGKKKKKTQNQRHELCFSKGDLRAPYIRAIQRVVFVFF